jgi:hypothetical protein
MAAPEFVPQPKDESARTYESPPGAPEAWLADRPAELDGPQPHGPRMGYPGPDQGFSLKLARRFEGNLVLTPGEDEADAIAGCVAVANKRAALAGRAPVIHDLTVAFAIWGYLAEADPELVRLRRKYFQAVANPHHYSERRRIADVVPAAALQMPVDALMRLADSDPRREKILRRRQPAGAAAGATAGSESSGESSSATS